MPSRFEPWFVLFVAGSVGIGLVGTGAISIASYHLHLANAEPVEATIVHSGVTKKTTGPGRQENPNVVYEYRYDGEVHRGDGVYAGVGPATMAFLRSSRSVVDRYAEGETVTAYVVSYGGGDSSPDATYLVGAGPRYYVYYAFIALGGWSTWAGVSIWLYHVLGIDLPMRAHLEE